MNEIKLGDVVTWSEPMDTNEARERFDVIEMKGDRCDIRFICNLPIPPVKTVMVADIKRVN